MYVPFSAIIQFFRVPLNVLVHSPGGKCAPGWESLLKGNILTCNHLQEPIWECVGNLVGTLLVSTL